MDIEKEINEKFNQNNHNPDMMSEMGDIFSKLLGNMSPPSFDVKFIKTIENAILPTYATDGSSGFDIYTPKDFSIDPGQRVLIKTGLQVAEIPEGMEVQIRSRSGNAYKKGIVVLNSPGTVDNDYRGDMGVILINHGNEAISFNNGDRIAQGVLVPYVKASLSFTTESNETERKDGGIGSTGD